MSNLTRHLAEMGHECVVYCESDHNGEEVENGVRLIYMKGPRSNLLCKPWVGLKATIRTLIKEDDVTAIHYNAWPPSLWSPLARLFGATTMMMGHGHEWQRTKYSPRQQRILRFMERLTARTNRHLLMCSKAQSDYFREHYGRRSVTMPTAVELPPAEPPASDILERTGITPRRYILFLGRMVQDKNPDVLIRAFRAASLQGYDLVMAGDNPADRPYVERLKALAGGEPSIHFTGAVYGADKDALLRNAALFCLPSTIEGLSIGLLEAISYRLPIIASDIEANREVLPPDNALWVKKEDDDSLTEALRRFAAGPGLLDEACEANFENLRQNYLWSVVARDYADYVQTITRSGYYE